MPARCRFKSDGHTEKGMRSARASASGRRQRQGTVTRMQRRRCSTARDAAGGRRLVVPPSVYRAPLRASTRPRRNSPPRRSHCSRVRSRRWVRGTARAGSGPAGGPGPSARPCTAGQIRGRSQRGTTCPHCNGSEPPGRPKARQPPRGWSPRLQACLSTLGNRRQRRSVWRAAACKASRSARCGKRGGVFRP